MHGKSEILFFAPYKEIADIVIKISQQLNMNVRVETVVMEESVEIAKEAERNGVEVIISRGATTATLKKECNLTILDMYENNLEILKGIQEAAKYGKKIALIWYNEIPYKEDLLYNLLQIKVNFYRYKTKNDIEDLVIRAVEDGADVIIGGIYTVRFAEKLGKKGVMVGSDEQSIICTLKQAQHIVDIKKQEAIKRARIETIIQNVHDGIIAVNQNGIITTFNPIAENILKISAVEAIGRNAKDVLPNAKLLEVLEGEDQLGVIQDMGTAIISTNRVKMKIRDKVVGAVATFQDVTKIMQLEQQIREKLYAKGYVANYSFDDIIGKSPAIVKTKNIAKKYAETDENILLIGESGTGKELFAQSIHNVSQRRDRPFIAVNCAELSNNLFESELFGYEEGAFTGARKGGKEGLFLLAHRGTIFLDEISEIPLNLQTVFLRVIQEKTIRPVGSNKIVPIDVRIIAASNKNLTQLIDEGKFREDLFYRINVLNVKIPPLNERKSDIPAIIYNISQKYNQDIYLSDDAMQLLIDYNWSGNIRELINVVKRLMALYKDKKIEKGDLLNMPEFSVYNTGLGLLVETCSLDEIILRSIEKALEITKGNQSQAAKLLGVSRTFIWRKLKNM
ncbi:MAG TPA: sigma 54-interacting transcriptional regulator [Thermoanaerobacterales bacterium]|nr:sigma 54-interacting transcriptional regulator [Thermoanaerobacterales bacterium]